MADKCPVCECDAVNKNDYGRGIIKIECPRCGMYMLPEEYDKNIMKFFMNIFDAKVKNQKRAALSHFIAKNSYGSNGNFLLDKNLFDGIKEDLKLPNPAEQADNLIRFLGVEASGDFGKEVQIDSLFLLGIMGSASTESAEMVIIELMDSELIKVEKFNVISSEII
jgi:hypothetical protein